jgi:hypothetical protein
VIGIAGVVNFEAGVIGAHRLSVDHALRDDLGLFRSRFFRRCLLLLGALHDCTAALSWKYSRATTRAIGAERAAAPRRRQRLRQPSPGGRHCRQSECPRPRPVPPRKRLPAVIKSCHGFATIASCLELAFFNHLLRPRSWPGSGSALPNRSTWRPLLQRRLAVCSARSRPGGRRSAPPRRRRDCRRQ